MTALFYHIRIRIRAHQSQRSDLLPVSPLCIRIMSKCIHRIGLVLPLFHGTHWALPLGAIYMIQDLKLEITIYDMCIMSYEKQ